MLVEVYPAKGGDPSNVTPKKDEGGRHTAGRTTKGVYQLDHAGKHVSSSWPLSKIPWGVPIKVNDRDKTDVLYEHPRGHWRSVRKRLGVSGAVDVVQRLFWIYERLTRFCSDKLPTTWVFNDFGHRTWYMVKYRRRTAVAAESRRIHPEFIHSSQINEIQTQRGEAVELAYSHGCIHLKPRDIDEMQRRGYLRAGNIFVVHAYDEKPMVREAERGALYKHYQVHFFPKVELLYVYGYGARISAP